MNICRRETSSAPLPPSHPPCPARQTASDTASFVKLEGPASISEQDVEDVCVSRTCGGPRLPADSPSQIPDLHKLRRVTNLEVSESNPGSDHGCHRMSGKVTVDVGKLPVEQLSGHNEFGRGVRLICLSESGRRPAGERSRRRKELF